MKGHRQQSPHHRQFARTGRQFTLVAALLGTSGIWLAGCQTPPPAAPAPPAVSTPPAPEPEPPAAPAPAPVPATPAAQQQAQKAALAAAELLESGNEDAARAELKRALVLDAQNKLALNFNRQLSVDPVAVLGRESFNYTVRQGETLSRIAERFMQGDRYGFVLLARYNGIAVPKQVGAGQVLKIPGKPRPGLATAAAPAGDAPGRPVLNARPPAASGGAAVPPLPGTGAAPVPPIPPATLPPATPPPEPTPGEKALRSAQSSERNGDLASARIDYLNAASLGQPGASAKAEQLGRALVQRYSVAAKGALARQDLNGSIASWQRVLDLEPNNVTARSEIERMKALKTKLGGLN